MRFKTLLAASLSLLVLAGKYIGGKASASLGVGLGAAILVGGSDDNFGLNPIAVGTNQGVGAAAGIGFLYIEAK